MEPAVVISWGAKAEEKENLKENKIDQDLKHIKINTNINESIKEKNNKIKIKIKTPTPSGIFPGIPNPLVFGPLPGSPHPTASWDPAGEV